MTRSETERDQSERGQPELSQPEPGQHEPYGSGGGTVHIDCDDCAVRGHGCHDCVISVLLGVPDTLLADEARALEVLADAGLAPRLRLVPIHRKAIDGVA